MKVKVKENLKVDEYYEGVMFVKGMEQYKGKIFNVEFIRTHPRYELIHLINLIIIVIIDGNVGDVNIKNMEKQIVI